MSIISKTVSPMLMFLFPVLGVAQNIISPYSTNPQVLENTPLGFEDFEEEQFGIFPFNGPQELQNLYESDLVNPPSAVSFSALLDQSSNAPTSFVEILSFIPDNSIFKTSLGVQLTSQEANDSTASPQDVAVQKLLNGGGNISLAFSRPAFYNQFWDGNFVVVTPTILGFFDVPEVNTTIYNPGVGAQFVLNSDFRIYTYGSSRQDGNLFRVGVRPGFTWNMFNDRYESKYNLANKFNNIAFGTFEFYLGLAFFDIRYTAIISEKDVFADRNSILEVGIVPVKF